MNENLSDNGKTLNFERLLKPTEIADLLNISHSFTYHLLETGALPSVRLGKVCRIRPQDLQAFIERNIQGQVNTL